MLISDGIHKNYTSCTFIVRLCNISKPLLPSSIPYLKLDFFIIDCNYFVLYKLKINKYKFGYFSTFDAWGRLENLRNRAEGQEPRINQAYKKTKEKLRG